MAIDKKTSNVRHRFETADIDPKGGALSGVAMVIIELILALRSCAIYYNIAARRLGTM